MDILYNDGYNHFHTVYVLNPHMLYAGQSTGTFNTLVNPKSSPVRLIGDNVLEISANIYKPIYVWIYKKGNVRYYPYKSSTLQKSQLHPGYDSNPKETYTIANTGEASTININIGNKSFNLEFGDNVLQIASMENPDHDDRVVDGSDITIPTTVIQINSYNLQNPAPSNSFGIGVSFYSTHKYPARDADKYIHY